VLVAISLPPLTEDTKRHSPTKRPIPAGRSRREGRRSLRSRSRRRFGKGAIASPPSSTQSAANETAIAPPGREEPPQPRAVVWGHRRVLPPVARRPGRRALLQARCRSSRRHRADRRAQTRQQDVCPWQVAASPSARRSSGTDRPRGQWRRYPDQNVIGDEHDGQSGRGNSISRPPAT
jgi:hypothetical protein